MQQHDDQDPLSVPLPMALYPGGFTGSTDSFPCLLASNWEGKGELSQDIYFLCFLSELSQGGGLLLPMTTASFVTVSTLSILF